MELPGPAVQTHAFAGDWQGAVRDIVTRASRAGTNRGGYELALHETVGARDGRHANNPWLLELPDPITRLTWGNVASIAPATAAALGVATGDVVTLTTETGKLELPAFVQPGQERRTISVAVGYGRWAAGKAGDGIGANVYPLARVEHGSRRLSAPPSRWPRPAAAPASPPRKPTSRWKAATSSSRLTLASLEHEPGRHPEHEHGDATKSCPTSGASASTARTPGACRSISTPAPAAPPASSPASPRTTSPSSAPSRCARAASCTGCASTVTSSGDGEDATSVHQPMMCQHCQHAPCETVCPVLATTTSSEGINQQVYNRCIGTRYCANNCPYKVRRFNWHNYTANDDFPTT